ncbi:cellulose binding domain-containing protein [Desulfitobacterium chlororespirans]|uniref:Cellulose binding domain-containing protein n=1 Tax=Desulfitobacterium chlororespirans DSM 11544 TaxID=1121395 RepID=A0A1M7RS77_9FIRM|nr:cellulose binding domain-containing protein [Desulfitobacterium chlororespirans]SHN48976.1 Cellulose binding domain-containing protein [Desulfitobacterium chlororespirans DSM 11544]
MKRVILLLALVLAMVSSITAGTLASYTVAIDNLAGGNVVAKEFIFVGEGTDTFQEGLKIAPSEILQWQFKVKNYERHVVTETDMYYKLTFDIFASPGKKAIDPLTVTVKDGTGAILNQMTGVGTFDLLGTFPLSETGQERNVLVEIAWPDGGKSDKDYAGKEFGTSIIVNAQASQVPLDSNPNPETPESQVSVLYETTTPWQNGQSGEYQYEYKVTITNNSSVSIEDWYITFFLQNDRLNNAWNAKLISRSDEGIYRFENPAYNNVTMDNILPGQSVSFGGLASGMGTETLRNIGVGGSNTSLITNVNVIHQP